MRELLIAVVLMACESARGSDEFLQISREIVNEGIELYGRTLSAEPGTLALDVESFARVSREMDGRPVSEAELRRAVGREFVVPRPPSAPPAKPTRAAAPGVLTVRVDAVRRSGEEARARVTYEYIYAHGEGTRGCIVPAEIPLRRVGGRWQAGDAVPSRHC